MLLYIILVIAILVINWIVSEEFYYVARQKGHDQRKYFWLCFLAGVAGYLLVIALPNTPVDKAAETKPTPPAANTPSPAPVYEDWTCARCGMQNRGNVNTCQSCGITKAWSEQQSQG